MSNKNVMAKLLTPKQQFQVQLINEQIRITKEVSRVSVGSPSLYSKMEMIATFISNLPSNEALFHPVIMDIFERCNDKSVLKDPNPFEMGMHRWNPHPKNPKPFYKRLTEVWQVVTNYVSQAYLADAGYISPLFGHDTLESLDE